MRRGYANAASGASTERHSCGKFMQAVSKAALRRAAALQAHEKSQQRFIHKHTVLGSFLARASASAHRCGSKQAQQTRQQHHPPLRQRRNRLHCTRCLCLQQRRAAGIINQAIGLQIVVTCTTIGQCQGDGVAADDSAAEFVPVIDWVGQRFTKFVVLGTCWQRLGVREYHRGATACSPSRKLEGNDAMG